MNREQIEQLLESYLNGDTTNEEEGLLRQYFTTTDIVPPEWRGYKALFCWEASRQHSAKGNDGTLIPRKPTRRYRFAVAACIAALLLVGAGIMVTLFSPSRAEMQTAQNYAVLDGHYTTDAAIIAREAEEALLMVSASDEDTFDAIDILATP